MSVLVVGISHKTAPGAPSSSRSPSTATASHKLVRDVADCEHVTEATVLATCNRIEIYADVDRFHGSVEDVSRLLVERAGAVDRGDAAAPLRALRRRRRLPPLPRRRRPGLDGGRRGPDPRPDPRGAARSARSSAPSAPPSTCCSSRRCASASASHAETDIDRAAPSLVTAALDRGRRRGRRRSPASGSLVVGAGSMAGLAAATVARAGRRRASRSPTAPPSAPHRLAEEYGGRAVAAGRPRRRAGRGRRRHLLHRRDRRCWSPSTMVAAARADDAPLAVIDLALPHDVDPAVGRPARASR